MVKNNQNLVLKKRLITEISKTFNFFGQKYKKNGHVFLSAFIWIHPSLKQPLKKTSISPSRAVRCSALADTFQLIRADTQFLRETIITTKSQYYKGEILFCYYNYSCYYCYCVTLSGPPSGF